MKRHVVVALSLSHSLFLSPSCLVRTRDGYARERAVAMAGDKIEEPNSRPRRRVVPVTKSRSREVACPRERPHGGRRGMRRGITDTLLSRDFPSPRRRRYGGLSSPTRPFAYTLPRDGRPPGQVTCRFPRLNNAAPSTWRASFHPGARRRQTTTALASHRRPPPPSPPPSPPLPAVELLTDDATHFCRSPPAPEEPA